MALKHDSGRRAAAFDRSRLRHEVYEKPKETQQIDYRPMTQLATGKPSEPVGMVPGWLNTPSQRREPPKKSMRDERSSSESGLSKVDDPLRAFVRGPQEQEVS